MTSSPTPFQFSLTDYFAGLVLFSVVVASGCSLSSLILFPACLSMITYLFCDFRLETVATATLTQLSERCLVVLMLFSLFSSCLAIQITKDAAPSEFFGASLLIFLVMGTGHSLSESVAFLEHGNLAYSVRSLANGLFACSVLSSIPAMIFVWFRSSLNQSRTPLKLFGSTALLISGLSSSLVPFAFGLTSLRIGFLLWAIPLNFFLITTRFSKRQVLMVSLILILETWCIRLDGRYPVSNE